MATMLRQNPISKLWENVEVPEEVKIVEPAKEDNNNSLHLPETSVKLNKVKPLQRGK